MCIHPIQRYHQIWCYPNFQRMSSKSDLVAYLSLPPLPSSCSGARVLSGVALPVACSLCVFTHVSHLVQRPPPPRVLALALLTVALPRARPTPRPRVPLDRNMGAFLYFVSATPLRTVQCILPQHVWDNEVPHMASTNVNLFKM
jgi:hypothetical protein